MTISYRWRQNVVPKAKLISKNNKLPVIRVTSLFKHWHFLRSGIDGDGLYGTICCIILVTSILDTICSLKDTIWLRILPKLVQFYMLHSARKTGDIFPAYILILSQPHRQDGMKEFNGSLAQNSKIGFSTPQLLPHRGGPPSTQPSSRTFH